MLAKYFSGIRNYVLSVSSQKNTILTTEARFSMLFERILTTLLVGMVIPLLANQDLTPMLAGLGLEM